MTSRPVVVLVAPRLEVFDAADELVLGRRPDARCGAVVLDDDCVSREHATVRFDGTAWWIADRGSHNGTFVDGVRVLGAARRHLDCVLRIGRAVLLLVRDGRGYDALASDASPELARVHDEVRGHASEPIVLVVGESGTGKSRLARLYHAWGPRAAGPFIAVRCAALAAADAARYVDLARGGTLFLDEIADLDPAVHAHVALARHAGVIAATREHQTFPLARHVVRVPPLRERRLDVARLVAAELGTLAAHARLLETCLVRPWPGNIHELRAALQLAADAARTAGRDVVRVEDLPAGAGLGARSRARDDMVDSTPWTCSR